jgi:hypothetical protein
VGVYIPFCSILGFAHTQTESGGVTGLHEHRKSISMVFSQFIQLASELISFSSCTILLFKKISCFPERFLEHEESEAAYGEINPLDKLTTVD